MNTPVFHSAFCILHSAFPVSRSPSRIVHCALCIVHCALCIALAFPAFAQSDAVRENNAKADAILREMAEHGRKSQYAEVTNCSAKVVALLALKEGAPANVTPYRLHMETGRALCANLHLHWAGLAAWHYAEALKAADTPRRKADATMAAGRLEYDVAAEDNPAPAIAKIRSALAVPGLSKADLLELVLRYPTEIDPGFDIAAEGWKIAADVPDLHGKYYEGVLPPRPRGQSTTLSPALSSEHVLEICRKALDDPAVTGGRRQTLQGREVDALIDLGREAEAEQRLLSLAATTDQRLRAMWSKRLGDFYVERARRYFLPSHEPTLQKALAAYNDAALADPRDWRAVESIYSTAMTLKDYVTAERAVALRVGIDKGATNLWTWSRLGCIAYAKGDYASAATAFGSAEDKLDLPERKLYARALKALGRIEETIAQLEKIEKVDNRFMKSTDRYYIQYLKKRP